MLSDNEIRKANQRLVRLNKQGLGYTPEYRKILRVAQSQGNSQVFLNKDGVPQFKRTKYLNTKNAGLVATVNENANYNVAAVKARNKAVESKIKKTFEQRHTGYNVEGISMRDVFDAVDQFDVYTYDNVVDAIKYYEDIGMDKKDIQDAIEKNVDNFVNKYGEDVAQHILRNTDALTKVMTGQALDDFDLDFDKSTLYDEWQKAEENPFD